MRLYVFFFLLPALARSRICVDDVKGACESAGRGWCFHDKTSGEFNCDEQRFCANQTQLQKKVQATGCFQRDNRTKCCCNENDGCNYGHIEVSPRTIGFTQQCAFSVIKPDESMIVYKECEDPWCFAVLVADEELGLTTVIRGCQSRLMIRHEDYLRMNSENQTFSALHQAIFEQPRCSAIADKIEVLNNTQRACIDFDFVENGIDHIGKLCCCRGTNSCNEQISWDDESRTIQDIKTQEDVNLSAMQLVTRRIDVVLVIMVLLG